MPGQELVQLDYEITNSGSTPVNIAEIGTGRLSYGLNEIMLYDFPNKISYKTASQANAYALSHPKSRSSWVKRSRHGLGLHRSDEPRTELNFSYTTVQIPQTEQFTCGLNSNWAKYASLKTRKLATTARQIIRG